LFETAAGIDWMMQLLAALEAAASFGRSTRARHYGHDGPAGISASRDVRGVGEPRGFDEGIQREGRQFHVCVSRDHSEAHDVKKGST